MQQLSLLDFVVDKNKPKNVFVLGNGESRDGYDLKQFRQWGKIYGCNALYRDYIPTYLFCIDGEMANEWVQNNVQDKCKVYSTMHETKKHHLKMNKMEMLY